MIWIALSIIVAGLLIGSGLHSVAKALNEFSPTQVIIKGQEAQDGFRA